ncbi:UvrD-helicase domain-containing protein, partial [Vagococcus fluvialis]|uniref:UvrD-helicase domain-containing protein n=2 Tax=Enterococcaceae TaxID=81852 RepID=UPI003D0BFB4F
KLVFDTAVAIDDEVLLSVLEKEATETMQDITSSIQKEQNDIIRDEIHSAILVNGVAGSGKTSVVMQRIAYLLYRNRQVVNSDNVLILSPNEEFIQYISDV